SQDEALGHVAQLDHRRQRGVLDPLVHRLHLHTQSFHLTSTLPTPATSASITTAATPRQMSAANTSAVEEDCANTRSTRPIPCWPPRTSATAWKPHPNASATRTAPISSGTIAGAMTSTMMRPCDAPRLRACCSKNPDTLRVA